MINSTSRVEKQIKFETNITFLEKLDIYEDYFKGKRIAVVDSNKLTFSEPNETCDILNQLKADLIKYFSGKPTTGIFDVLDSLIKNAEKKKNDYSEIVQFVVNTKFDIERKLYNNPH